MRALRWHGAKDVRLDDIPEPPPPGDDEVTVEVEWCGICGTDLEEYLHGPLLIPTTPHPLTGHAAPLVLGHEVSARVVAAGRAAGLRPGPLVALDGYYFCGTCVRCARHEVQLCERWGHIGLSAPGGLAERMTVPAQMAIPATADIASDLLALAEPFSVAVRAARRGRIGRGDRVGVLGAGTIGLAVLQVAKQLGAAEVVVADPTPHRRTVAAALGSGVVASASELEAAYDVVVDCTGRTEAVGAGLAALRRGGTLVVVGIPPATAELDVRRIVLEELTVTGSIGHVWDEDFATAVDLVCTGVVDAGALITHRLPLDRAVDEGFALLADRGDQAALKILVSPRST
jgi:(R,R)-butanediol dehydrogenase/meso-butanediol dehydrogenase/diacetyl reductase